MARVVGIDYGSKLAGTTAIAIFDTSTKQILMQQSAKKQDADAFVLSVLLEHPADFVGIDAPLSLPGVYRGLEGNHDFHYRAADRQATAMSPMFLGGLTARAMKLASEIDATTIEVYPKLGAERHQLQELNYKGNKEAIATCLMALVQRTELPVQELSIENWHQFDALLALEITWRYHNNLADHYGDAKEGMLYF
jgi:predicted nuclease with RNAse H fold